MNLKLDDLNLNVRNLDESIQWYQNIFGFEVVEHGFYFKRPWAIIKKDNLMLALNQIKEKPSSDKDYAVYENGLVLNHFALRFEESEKQWLQKIKENRLQTYFDSPVNWPHSTSWYVKDPNGYNIEVVKWKANAIQFDSMDSKYSSISL